MRKGVGTQCSSFKALAEGLGLKIAYVGFGRIELSGFRDYYLWTSLWCFFRVHALA